MKETNLAVVGIVVYEGKCLFLKRNNPPLNWGAPAGKLHENEDPALGLKREVREETGLEVEVLLPVDVWQGVPAGYPIYSITYVCLASSDQVKLSHEHADYRWVELNDLDSIQSKTDFDTSRWPLLVELALDFQQRLASKER